MFKSFLVSIILFLASFNLNAKTLYDELWEEAIAYGGFVKACEIYTCSRPNIAITDISPYAGLFIPPTPTMIFIDEKLEPGSEWWKSTIIHEYVHVLQYATKVPAATCQDLVNLEIYANETELNRAIAQKLPEIIKEQEKTLKDLKKHICTP